MSTESKTPRTEIICDNLQIAFVADNREQSINHREEAIREIEAMELELAEANRKLEAAKKALNFYAKCDGCTCGDGWSHEPAVEALATINQKEMK